MISSNLFSNYRRQGTTLAGVFSLALSSVLLLCGAGLTPTGNVQTSDINANGHSLTNAATVQAASVYANTLTATNAITGPASGLTNFPSYATMGLGSAATNNASAFQPASAPAGSVFVGIGDSTWGGTPYTTYDGSNHQAGGAGTDSGGHTGYSSAQEMSASPFWYNTPIYDLGIPGTRSDDGANRMTGSNWGTEYLHGAVVGSYGSVTASAVSLLQTAASTGKAYFLAVYGINDNTAAYSTSTYITNMTGIYSAAHGAGSNVVVIGYSVQQFGNGGVNSPVIGYNNALWALPSQIGATSSCWDTMADIGGIFSQEGDLLATAGFLQSDATHPTTQGYAIIAREITRAVITGPGHQFSIITPQYLYNSTGRRCFDITTGNTLSSGQAVFFAQNQVIGNAYGQTVLDANNLNLQDPSTGYYVVRFGNGSYQLKSHGNAGTPLDWYTPGTLYSYNSNFAIDTAGYGLQVKEGTNGKQGVVTLSGGTATVSNTSVTVNSRIHLTAQSLGTVSTPQALAVTARTAGTSFTITSASSSDTSVVAWEIFEPAP